MHLISSSGLLQTPFRNRVPELVVTHHQDPYQLGMYISTDGMRVHRR